MIKNCIVWDKDWFGMGNNWRANHEFILVLTNGKFMSMAKESDSHMGAMLVLAVTPIIADLAKELFAKDFEEEEK